MKKDAIELIPVDKIRVANPRSRNKVAWALIVASIQSVGLKKPILVHKRATPDGQGATFDLVCGQGRLEAFKELKQALIPAICTEAPEDDRYLMSLVENIARRPPSNAGLFHEVRALCERGYDAKAIGAKIGLNATYVYGLVRLVEKGEGKLIQEVESGRLPISVAIEIANGNHEDVQRLLSEGYASGEFRGSKLKMIRRLINRRAVSQGKVADPKARVATRKDVVKLFKRRVAEQQRLLEKADRTKDRMLVIVSAVKALLADEDFRTVLKAEGLLDMPESLRQRIG